MKDTGSCKLVSGHYVKCKAQKPIVDFQKSI